MDDGYETPPSPPPKKPDDDDESDDDESDDEGAIGAGPQGEIFQQNPDTYGSPFSDNESPFSYIYASPQPQFPQPLLLPQAPRKNENKYNLPPINRGRIPPYPKYPKYQSPPPPSTPPTIYKPDSNISISPLDEYEKLVYPFNIPPFNLNNEVEGVNEVADEVDEDVNEVDEVDEDDEDADEEDEDGNRVMMFGRRRGSRRLHRRSRRRGQNGSALRYLNMYW
jgi:hypothetical protein